MLHLLNISIGLLAIGIFTSVSVLGAHQALFGIAVVYFLYQSIKSKKFKLTTSGYFLLGFAVVSLLSCIVNHDDLIRVSKNYGKIKYDLIAIFSPFALYFFIQNSTPKSKKILANLFLTSIIIAATYGIIDCFFIRQLHRINGLTNTMRYGYGTAMILILLLGFLIRPKLAENYFHFNTLIVATIAAALGMYFTYTRGAMAGFLIGAPVCFFLWNKKWGSIIGGIFIACLIIISSFYFFGDKLLQPGSNRFLISNKNSSDQIRKSQWQAAVIAIKERPIFGWGPSNFHSQVARIKQENNLGRQDYVDHHSHNLFLETAAGTGLIGFFFFMGWLLLWLKETYLGNKTWFHLMLPFFITACVGAQFEVISDANNLSMIYFLYGLSCAINFQHFRKSSLTIQ